MSEPLKNLYTRDMLMALSFELEREHEDFDSSGFISHVFDEQWAAKELKARMAHISRSLHKFLPPNYGQKVEILKIISPGFSGFEYMFFPGFVEIYGLEHYSVSISALEHFTEHASSEFAVRPFINKYGGKMMAQMNRWAESENYHVRRLASEGCRPRLPWAMALPAFKNDPEPVLRILEKLRNDESEYVRRSVANNLNDIAKDNPAVVIEIAKNWLGENPQTDWLVKHGCRTLLKQGIPDVMALFGYHRPEHVCISELVIQNRVEIGGNFEFSFVLTSQLGLGKLRIEYAIDFLRKNGSYSRKLFKISESKSNSREKQVSKKHSFREITTRKYYAGMQGIAIVVNGIELGMQRFKLVDK